LDGKMGRRRGGSTVPEADDTANSGGAVAGVWRLKMTKGNWVGGPNARLGQTADWAGKKI
jgi:hypothetical protein